MEIAVPDTSNLSCDSVYKNYHSVITTVDSLDVKACTECSPFLIQMESMCSNDLCCIVNPQIGVNISEDIVCYWKQANGCVTLTGRQSNNENFVNASQNVSCFIFNSSLSNITGAEEMAVLLFDTQENDSYSTDSSSSENYWHLAAKHNIDLSPCDSNASASCVCEAFSDSPYHCFWNPNSRLSGEYCPRCEPLCRSVDHSINFAQLIVGLCLFTPGFPMSRVVLTVIVSDCIGDASQVSYTLLKVAQQCVRIRTIA